MACSPELIPQRFLAGAKATAAAFRDIDYVLVACHVNPDGDAAGAMASCGYILQDMGKSFALYAPCGIPAYLGFLALPGPIYESLASLPFTPAAAIYVDCSEPGRLGAALAESWDIWTSINIDHHICQHGLGSIANFVEPAAAATCQLMAYIAIALNLPVAGNMATAIGLGILTDTGNFSHSNTTADVFALCAELEKNGCSLAAIREQLSSNWTIDRLRLWGELFTHARLASNNRVIFSVILEEDLRRHDCSAEDMEGYIDALRRIKNVSIALTVRQSGAECKFSLRSRKGTDVQKIAAALGGGGHINAAGGVLELPPDLALASILAEIENYYLKNDSK